MPLAVVGSPTIRTTVLLWFLRFLIFINLFFDWLGWFTWGLRQSRITDMINGYRALTIDAWDRMKPDGPGYTIEYQMSIRAYKHRLRVIEFPTVEGPRIGGSSEAKSIQTGLRFVRLYLRELWRSVLHRVRPRRGVAD